jgi:hypothetical protein
MSSYAQQNAGRSYTGICTSKPLLLHTCRLTGCCQVVELAGERDYRRLMAKGPAAQLLQQPLTPLAEPPSGQPQVTAPSGTSHSSSDAGGATSSALPQAADAAAAGAATGAQPSVGPVDTSSTPRLYFWPLGPAADAALQQAWTQWTGSAAPGAASPGATSQPGPAGSSTATVHETKEQQLAVLFGRQLPVPRAARGAAWFSFEELCNRPLGAADYLALSTAFHTVFLSGEVASGVPAALPAVPSHMVVSYMFTHSTRWGVAVCMSLAAGAGRCAFLRQTLPTAVLHASVLVYTILRICAVYPPNLPTKKLYQLFLPSPPTHPPTAPAARCARHVHECARPSPPLHHPGG